MSIVKYTKDHEWIRVEGDVGTVGITDHAQHALGDIVFIEVPEIGRTLAVGDEAAVVESVKAASEVYSPVSGVVLTANAALTDAPALVNTNPEDEGWFFTIKLADPAELDGLLDADAYKLFAESEG